MTTFIGKKNTRSEDINMGKNDTTVADTYVPIKPSVGDRVTNQMHKVYNEEVIEVNDEGFICKYSGLWHGTNSNWRVV
jgi:hypothetical protein